MSLSGEIDGTTIIELLSLCTGINNLVLLCESNYFEKDTAPLLQVLDTLPLDILSLQMDVSLTPSSIANTNVFARLTHLEITEEGIFKHLKMNAFPRLTHLALWGGPLRNQNGLKLIKHILSHATLQLLLLHVRPHRQLAKFLDINNIDDPRIVLAPCEIYVWDSLGRASMLLWELADEKVKLRVPNHRKHRCFTETTLVNELRQYMDLESVPEQDLDYQVMPCYVVGGSGDEAQLGYVVDDDESDD
ncbi:hypothetical protein BDR07DRAFT_1377593 [Suillus spraguei]|nr:hypothetical protein BDR07DRAFT_1377593 [Suillus spraguei]